MIEHNSNQRSDERDIRPCVFCGGDANGGILVQGVPVCPRCVTTIGEAFVDLFYERLELQSTTEPANYEEPAEIKAILDRYVVGHEAAKEVLSVLLFAHLQRWRAAWEQRQRQDGVTAKVADADDETGERPHVVLLVGPTGVGKTLLAQAASSALNCPLIHISATQMAAAGWYGIHVEELFSLARGNPADVEHAIVFIDEIDKTCIRPSASGHRDPSTEGVQQALLPLLGGTHIAVRVPGEIDEVISIPTHRMLFILAGTFTEITDAYWGKRGAKRRQQRRIGFNPKQSDEQPNVQELRPPRRYIDMLIQAGMMPELVGRIECIVPLRHLRQSDLIQILDLPNGPLAELRRLASDMGKTLVLRKDARQRVVELAVRHALGARGIRQILSASVLPKLYSKKRRVIVSARDVREDYTGILPAS